MIIYVNKIENTITKHILYTFGILDFCASEC